MAHDLEVVLGRLAEAEARVDDQVSARDAGFLRPIEGGSQVGQELGHEVGVLGHRAVVHDDERDLPLPGEAGHGVVARHAPDIVEEHRPRGQGGRRDFDLGGIDADRDPRQRGVDRGDHRDGAGRLLGRGHGLVARSRRLRAHVENVGSLFDHAPRLDDGGLDGGAPAASD